MLELVTPKFRSTIIHSLGFDGEKRGTLHIQFQDKQGALTVRGYYVDVPQALFNAMVIDRKPGAFIEQHLKHRFEWVTLAKGDAPEQTVDPTLPDDLYIPADVAGKDEAAIDACINSQRLQPAAKGLFE